MAISQQRMMIYINYRIVALYNFHDHTCTVSADRLLTTLLHARAAGSSRVCSGNQQVRVCASSFSFSSSSSSSSSSL